MKSLSTLPVGKWAMKAINIAGDRMNPWIKTLTLPSANGGWTSRQRSEQLLVLRTKESEPQVGQRHDDVERK